MLAGDGAAKSVDGLVVVADGENRRVRAGEQAFSHLYCRALVSWNSSTRDVREAPLVVRAQRILAGQHLVGSQQKLGEVDHAFALACLLVQGVMLDLPAAELVEGLDLVGVAIPPPWMR